MDICFNICPYMSAVELIMIEYFSDIKYTTYYVYIFEATVAYDVIYATGGNLYMHQIQL